MKSCIQYSAQLLTVAGVLLAWRVEIAEADGGRLIHVSEVHGFRISLFVAPETPRVGLVDLSVMLQELATGQVVVDVEMAISLRSQDDSTLAVSGPATRRQATNKLLHAAWIKIPQAGRWNGEIRWVAHGLIAEAPFDLEVAAAQPPWLALSLGSLWPIGAVLLFIAHRALAARQAAGRRQRGRTAERFSKTSRSPHAV